MISEYTIEGTSAGGQTWKTKGRVSTDYPECMLDAMQHSFLQLTQGKAVFGQPGVGCRGPYKINRVELVTVERSPVEA
jgi:hypothetical protein